MFDLFKFAWIKSSDGLLNLIVLNDIIKLLGPASTKSTFDNDVWIYIERVKSSSKVLRLGKKDLIENNVLILEINNKGIVISNNEEYSLLYSLPLKCKWVSNFHDV